VAHLTKNFTSEAPLSPVVREAISAALEQGWADPKKQSQAASKAAIIRDSALAEIASHLGTTPDRLEVIGEPSLLHFFALMGFKREENLLYSSTIDLGKVRAIARHYGDPTREMGVDENGQYIIGNLRPAKKSVVAIQATNGETGANQELERWRGHAAHIVLDATRALPTANLIEGFAATTFEATSWGGPTGLGILAIGDAKSFRYPLPHIAPIRTPGSYSIPLLVGSAIALNEFITQNELLVELRERLSNALAAIEGVTVLAKSSGARSRNLSIVIDDFSSEEILRTLLQRDVAVDAGSACSPEDLTPSHVIASMGYPTTGHLRFTIHPGHNEGDIHEVAAVLKEVLQELRR
jgi:cysteine desulfurase